MGEILANGISPGIKHQRMEVYGLKMTFAVRQPLMQDDLVVRQALITFG